MSAVLQAATTDIGDGPQSTRRTLAQMRTLVDQFKIAVPIRRQAMEIVKDLPGKDYLGEAEALTSWVRDNIRYLKDPEDIQILQDPVVTLSLRQGKCADQAALLVAMAESIGGKGRFVAIGPNKDFYNHVFAQLRVGGRWYTAETTEPWAFGQNPPAPVAVMVWPPDNVPAFGGAQGLGGAGILAARNAAATPLPYTVPPPRGPNPYPASIFSFDPFANPGPYNDLTKAQWDAFYSNVTGDAHDRLVTAALESPSLMQAFYGMVAPIADPFIGFNTDPPRPLPDIIGLASTFASPPAVGAGGTGAGGGPNKTGTRTMLQGLGAVGDIVTVAYPPAGYGNQAIDLGGGYVAVMGNTNGNPVPYANDWWGWYYNAVKTGFAKASEAWDQGASVQAWDARFNEQQRLATQVGDIVAVVASAVGIGEAVGAAAGSTATAGTATAGAADTGVTASTVAADTTAVDTSSAALTTIAPTTTTIAASTIAPLSAADIGTAATVAAAAAPAAAAPAASAASTLASDATTAAQVAKAASTIIGADLAVQTSQAQLDATTAQIAAAQNAAARPTVPQPAATAGAAVPASGGSSLLWLALLLAGGAELVT